MQVFGSIRTATYRCFVLVSFAVITASLAHAKDKTVDGQPCNDLCQAWLSARLGQENVKTTVHFEAPIKKDNNTSLLKAEREGVPNSALDYLQSKAPPVRKRKFSHDLFSEGSSKKVKRLARDDVPLPPAKPAWLETAGSRKADTPLIAAPAPVPESNLTKPVAAAALGRPENLAEVPSRSPALTIARDASAPQLDLRKGSPLSARGAGSQTDFGGVSSGQGVGTAGQGQSSTQPASGVALEAERPASPVSKPPSEADAPTQMVTLRDEVSVASGTTSRAGDTLTPDSNTAIVPTSGLLTGGFSVAVGQITANQQSTDIHIIVVNLAQRAATGVRVQCNADDLQGNRIAEMYSEIDRIDPSDVAFQQLSFPPSVRPANSRFFCVAQEEKGSSNSAKK